MTEREKSKERDLLLNDILTLLIHIRNGIVSLVNEAERESFEYISLEESATRLAMSQRQVKSICRDFNIPVIAVSARMNVVNYRLIQDELHRRNNEILAERIVENMVIDTGDLPIKLKDEEYWRAKLDERANRERTLFESNGSSELDEDLQKGNLSPK